MYPETKYRVSQAIGMNRAIGNNVGENFSSTSKSFVQDTAEKLGVTPRIVARQMQTAKNLTKEAKKIIKDAEPRIKKETAFKLSRLDPGLQEEAANMLASGKVRSVEQYNAFKANQETVELGSPSGAPSAENQANGGTAPADQPEKHPHSDVPYCLPDKKFSSFEESVADLKDPNKDCSCTPDIFLAEYSGFIHKFIKDIKWYSTPQYTEVFPALSQIQVDYLRSQTKALCDAAEELLHQVERTNNA